MDIYVAGRVIGKCDAGFVWEILGVYTERSFAEKACYDQDCFIGPLEIDVDLPKKTTGWPGCYFPARRLADEQGCT